MQRRAAKMLLSRALFHSLATQGTPPTTSRLSDVRGVLRLSGPTLVHFLQVGTGSGRSRAAFHHREVISSSQGLVTNDVAHLDQPKADPLYACILNAQGRYLHDLFLIRTAGAARPTA